MIKQVDFSVAIYFTRLFARRWLEVERPHEVDVLKIDIPASATPETPWQMARLERGQYFVPLPPLRRNLGDVGRIGYTINREVTLDEDSDAAIVQRGLVAVTPLVLDITTLAPDCKAPAGVTTVKKRRALRVNDARMM